MTVSDLIGVPCRAVSKTVTSLDGEPVVVIDALSIGEGQKIVLTFEAGGPRWRQWVFLATNGSLVAARTSSSSLILWSDTARQMSVIDVADADDRLVVSNV